MKAKYKLVCAVAALSVAVTCAAGTAFAAPEPKPTIYPTGIVLCDTNSPLGIKSQTVTFNITDVVREGQSLPANAGQSTAVTEYVIENPTDTAVTARLAYPVGEEYLVAETEAPQITVNGSAVTPELRFVATDSGYSGLATDIRDDLYTTAFYTPDMPVTKYKVTVNAPQYQIVQCKGAVVCNASTTRYVGDGRGGLDLFFYNNEQSQTANEKYYYVIGDESAFSVDWSTEVYTQKDGWQETQVAVTVEQAQAYTLKEAVLEKHEADRVISETDWYNAVVSSFSNTAQAASDLYGMFYGFYSYKIEVGAHSTATTAVTAKAEFKRLDYYNPQVYEYTYKFPLTDGWASYSDVNFVINTSAYMLGKDYTESDSGYFTHFVQPPSEVSFLLSSRSDAQTYNRRWHHSDSDVYVPFAVFIAIFSIAFLACVGGVTAGAVYLVKSKKKDLKDKGKQEDKEVKQEGKDKIEE